MTWRELFQGCWFSHAEMFRERRGKAYLLICERCGTEKRILPKQKYRARKDPKVIRFQQKAKAS